VDLMRSAEGKFTPQGGGKACSIAQA